MNKEPPSWTSLEELEKTPEYLKTRGKEFPEPPQLQEISAMERREFLKLMGAGFLLAATACTRRPVEKIIPYVNKPEEITPGVPNWYASTCQECSAGCGVLVKNREGRPIKLEGNDSHPLNEGGLCARGQASILNLYDPDRIKGPQLVSRLDGFASFATWTQVDDIVFQKLNQIKNEGKQYGILTGAITSPSTRFLFSEFFLKYPGGRHVAFEAVVPEEVTTAQNLSYGEKIVPRYRLDKAKMILSLGADFLGTWLSPVEFSKKFSVARKVDQGKCAQLVVIESGVSLTGLNADKHAAIRSGDELNILLAIANEIIVQRRLSDYASDSVVTRTLAPHTVQAIAEKTGLDAAWLRQVAVDLWENKGESVVLGAGIKAKNAVEVQIVANLLNSALENDGSIVDAGFSPSHQAVSSYDDLLKLASDMQAGQIELLMMDGTNPLYTLPKNLGFDKALKKVPLVVYFSDRLDETAKASDIVIARSHYLESWSDANPQRGLFSLVQPTIRSLYDTRTLQDCLVQWAFLDDATWHDYLKRTWQRALYKNYRGELGFEDFWEETLKKGFFDARNLPSNEPVRLAKSRWCRSGALDQLNHVSSEGSKEASFGLNLYPSIALYDGRSANNVWLQELPDPITKITWDNYVSIAPKTADQMGLREGDIVNVLGNQIEFEVPVHLQPMLHEQVLTMAVGYGRTEVGRVGNGIGINAFPAQSGGHGLLEWGGLTVNEIVKTGKKYKLATTQGHQSMVGRPIIKETTFEEFKKNPEAGNEDHHELATLWTQHDYPGNRWGMAIDLSSCTGCGACMIGCQSENNVPTVGKEQVLRGRDMHWLRIDRYYRGDRDHPEVAFQPMLCQHCENAPCETVCPVIATVHDKEGLNTMIYNRCVGTRYCSNNCPYKVRRFNYFDYMEKVEEPMALVLNPDISVRSQGVMEKCTFCTQRIVAAKDHANDEGREIRDGEIKTACQQSCPTDAIVFGNVNDPNSLVSKLRKSKRGYHVLEELNTVPQVTYLTKVRNG